MISESNSYESLNNSQLEEEHDICVEDGDENAEEGKGVFSNDDCAWRKDIWLVGRGARRPGFLPDHKIHN